MRRGGNSDKARRQTSVEKYGVEIPMQSNEILEKRKQTCLEVYGVESVSNITKVIEKKRQTFIRNWGADHPMKTTIGRQRHSERLKQRTVEQRNLTCMKTRHTNLERYGVEHLMSDPTSEYRKQRDATMLERYGNVIPTKTDVVKEKTQQTCRERFGAPYPMMNDDIKAKMIDSTNLRGLYRKSRPEDRMFELLIEQFGIDDVKRQVRPKNSNWSIDFYVQSIDTWIQIDGVYWHGLDRPIEMISQHNTLRDYNIEKNYYRDQRQNKWFAEHNMKLLRFTDCEVNKMSTLPNL